MWEVVRSQTGLDVVEPGERLQRLWGGYGEVRRLAVRGSRHASVVVKRVQLPPAPADPHARRSHERKLRSYDVERNFYHQYSARCGPKCRVPAPLHVTAEQNGWLFVLEDLEHAGFARRVHAPRNAEIATGLRWLAAFHATFLGQAPEGLWKSGCYWHLATRPDELAALGDAALAAAAHDLDAALEAAEFKTLVHGDAKLENFLFDDSCTRAAALDFQYVGGGAGIRDVAYFLTSALGDSELERVASGYLDLYFAELGAALREDAVPASARDRLEREWRDLFSVAWADFWRFYAGWAPGQRPEAFSRRLIADALRRDSSA